LCRRVRFGAFVQTHAACPHVYTAVSSSPRFVPGSVGFSMKSQPKSVRSVLS
jgi:hypothetical protein